MRRDISECEARRILRRRSFALRCVWVVAFVIGAGFVCFGCGEREEAAGEPTAAGFEGEEEVSAEDLPIRPKVGIGEVRFGMTADEVKGIWGEADRVVEEGGFCYYLAKGVVLQAQEETGVTTIWCSRKGGGEMGIAMETFKGRTEEGIGIGSSEQEVVEAYGEPTMKGDWEAGTRVLMYEPMEMMFMTLGGEVVGISFAQEGYEWDL